MRETREKGWVGARPPPLGPALTPLSRPPGPATPLGSLPARAAFNPAGTPSSPEAPRGPKGRGEVRVRGQGAVAAGPASPRPSRHPHPSPHPHPGPRRPRRSPRSGPGWTCVRPPAVAARGRPRGPQVPRPRHPGAGPSHPFILSPGPGAGRRIPGLT